MKDKTIEIAEYDGADVVTALTAASRKDRRGAFAKMRREKRREFRKRLREGKADQRLFDSIAWRYKEAENVTE